MGRQMSNLIEISSEDKGEILDTFSRLAELLISLERTCENSNSKEIMRLLHNLKGTMQMIGFDQLGEFVHHLETKFLAFEIDYIQEYVDVYLISINSIEQHFLDEMDCYDDHLLKQIESLGKEVKRKDVRAIVSDIVDGDTSFKDTTYEKVDSSIIPEDVGVVFVLDDERDILKSIKESFSNLNMVVMTFSSPDRFVSTLADIKPDLIMMDYHLESVKGVDVYNQHVRKKNIPTIFMTSDISKDTFESILLDKNIFFLEKPLRYFEMISSVISALEQGKMRRMIDSMIDLERTILSHFPQIKESLEEKSDFKSIFEIREAYRMLMKYRRMIVK